MLLTFQQRYQLLSQSFSWPSLKLRQIAGSIPNDGYHASLRGGELEITAASPLGLSYGVRQCMTALQSGHLEEFLGRREPCFSFRPLWLSSLDNFDASTIVELGYNAIIVNEWVSAPNLLVGVAINDMSHMPQQADFIFYHSHPHLLPDDTVLDAVSRELESVESQLPEGMPLVFHLQSSSCLTALADIAGKHTILAFEASSFTWEMLRRQKDPSTTRLLPVYRPHKGIGLWPVLAVQEIDGLIANMTGPYFTGAITVVDHLPAGHGPLAANLWALGHAQWNRRSASHLFQTWFAAYRPDFLYTEHAEILNCIEWLQKELQRFETSDEYPQARIDISLANLRLVENWLKAHDEDESSRQTTTITDYIRYFVRDACCLLYYHIDRLRLTYQGVPASLSHEGGFWASLSSQGGRSIPTSATVTPMTDPRVLEDEPQMALIFNEN
jgi:hypothetical protein